MSFPTPTELKILGVLRDAPRGLYGLQIVERGISRGSVYVLLARLQDKGYVQVRSIATSVGVTRPHYKLSALGERVVDMVDTLHLRPQGV